MDYEISLRFIIAALCGGVAAYLAIRGLNGWGWFLFGWGWFLFVAILLVP